jgi:Spy/CpxP family protein refolding chaperone
MARRLLLALASAALLGSPFAYVAAADPGPPPGMHSGPGSGFDGPAMMPGLINPGLLRHVGDEIGLTEAQRATIKGYFDAARPRFAAARTQLHANAQLLANTKPDDPNYANVVAQVSQSAGQLASQMVTDGGALRAQIWQQLSPAQRTKLTEIEARFHDRMQQHLQHAGPASAPPPPPQ